MKLLLDTQILLWASVGSDRLSSATAERIEDESADLLFSAASIWEVAIKAALARRDFDFDPHLLRRGLLDNGYVELPITGQHGAHVATLPTIHRDPFDRIMIAQATLEGVSLLTVDATVARYPGPIELVT